MSEIEIPVSTENIKIETPQGITPDLPQAKEPLKSVSHYTQHLRKRLPAEVLQPYPQRFITFFAFVSIAAMGLLAIKFLDLAWPLKFLLGIVIGTGFGGMTFFAHELLHGSVVKKRSTQDFFGFFGFMPFFISPTFWRYWHNHLHHSHTQEIITDPDAFPILRIFKHSKFIQAMFPYTPGSGHKRSYAYFFFWFSYHCLVAQFYLRSRNSIYDKLNHRRVSYELAGQVIIWSALLLWIGPQHLLWTFAIPLAIQNYFVMSYIATNHNLNPLTKLNDPLVNTLTVTNHPVLEWLHMNFGYHVEHHLFPTMNGAHAKKLHEVLKTDYPDQYLYMPKSEAMKKLYQTSRIYKSVNVLINPETGKTYDTI